MLTEYKLKPGIFAEYNGIHMKGKFSAYVRYGNPNLTPTVRQWRLNVVVGINGRRNHFDMNENLTRCFSKSDFYNAWKNSRFEQKKNGFTAVMSNPDMDTFSGHDRPELETVEVYIQIFHHHDLLNKLYDQTIVLCDYAFCCLSDFLGSIAPAAFTGKYKEIMSLEQYYRPIISALKLDENGDRLRISAEQAVLQRSSNTQPQWQYAGHYFGKVPFQIRNVLDIDSLAQESHNAEFF